jgi:hypothetical protein
MECLPELSGDDVEQPSELRRDDRTLNLQQPLVDVVEETDLHRAATDPKLASTRDLLAVAVRRQEHARHVLILDRNGILIPPFGPNQEPFHRPIMHGSSRRVDTAPRTLGIVERPGWVLVEHTDSLAPGGSVARREAFRDARPQFDPHDVMIVDCCAGVSESIWPLTNIASLRRRSV